MRNFRWPLRKYFAIILTKCVGAPTWSCSSRAKGQSDSYSRKLDWLAAWLQMTRTSLPHPMQARLSWVLTPYQPLREWPQPASQTIPDLKRSINFPICILLYSALLPSLVHSKNSVWMWLWVTQKDEGWKDIRKKSHCHGSIAWFVRLWRCELPKCANPHHPPVSRCPALCCWNLRTEFTFRGFKSLGGTKLGYLAFRCMLGR